MSATLPVARALKSGAHSPGTRSAHCQAGVFWMPTPLKTHTSAKSHLSVREGNAFCQSDPRGDR